MKPVTFKIIASTASCTVYTMNKERLKLIPDNLRIKLLDGLYKHMLKQAEFHAEIHEKEDIYWNDFKEALQDEVILENYKNRNVGGRKNKTYKLY